MNLPPDFLGKMQRLLGAEYEAFVESYQRPLHHALRFNTLKTSPASVKTEKLGDLGENGRILHPKLCVIIAVC
jgi:16S rRNA C967 or C1407 C5-methylase (RsmB/RsmF family)